MSFSGRPCTTQWASSCPQPPPSIMPAGPAVSWGPACGPPLGCSCLQRLPPPPNCLAHTHPRMLLSADSPACPSTHSPALLKPQPRKKPRSSGASPIRGLWSGVKDSARGGMKDFSGRGEAARPHTTEGRSWGIGLTTPLQYQLMQPPPGNLLPAFASGVCLLGTPSSLHQVPRDLEAMWGLQG